MVEGLVPKRESADCFHVMLLGIREPAVAMRTV